MTGRVLFCCWPFEGHVLPQMSIAAALRERGVDVGFYTGPERRAMVEGEGFAFFGFGRVGRAWERTLALEESTGGRRQSLRVQRQAFREWLVESIPDQVADLRAILDEWRPDALACDLSMWGPIVVLWESVPIPVALSSTLMGPMIPGPDAPPWGFGLKPPRTRGRRVLCHVVQRATDAAAAPLRKRIDAIRADYGLGPMNSSINAFTGRLPLYLVPSLPELDYGRSDLSDRVHYTGYCLWHPPDDPRTAAWLDALPQDRPWVHVTEGTSHHQEPFVLLAAAAGLAGCSVEAILTTGRGRDRERLGLGSTSSNVHIAEWLSHAELLPRCRAVVSTGGPATIMAALRAGVPLVIVPTTWDKPDNARRVIESGVGIRLAPRHCTPARLRDAVDLVLEDPSYRSAAQALARRLATAPGPAGAAALLETLLPSTAIVR